jgi:hypothetical protein
MLDPYGIRSTAARELHSLLTPGMACEAIGETSSATEDEWAATPKYSNFLAYSDTLLHFCRYMRIFCDLLCSDSSHQ